MKNLTKICVFSPFVFLCILFVAASCKKEVLVPSVATVEVSSTTQTTAISGGIITSDGGAPVAARGVCWSTGTSPTISDSKTTEGSGTGPFTSSIIGLTANTTYSVRAYATNSVGTGYGEVVSFTTNPVIVSTPSTIAVTDITQTTAVSGGILTGDGGSPVFARGVCWSTSETPTISDNKTIDGEGLGSFSSSLIGLTVNTAYYVRAYATNNAGTGYGDAILFTTSPALLPTLSTSPVNDISPNAVTCGGNITNDGGANITERGVCWSNSPSPTINNAKTIDGVGIGVFSSHITGLVASTNYYVRAYATNIAGTNYGNEVSFTTSNASIPVIETTSISNITQTTANGGGNITSDGGAPVETRGVCWSTAENPTILDSKTNNGTGSGIFISNLTSLTYNTTYYARAYCTNNVGTGYGLEVSFITRPNLPTVTTIGVTNVLRTTATSGGNITNDGGASVTERGVCWATSPNPTIANAKTSDGFGTGTYNSDLTGLTGLTTYYLRAYATNSAGTSYGDEISFTTAKCDEFISDSRDGQRYCYKTIGTKTWMTENLSYLPSVSPGSIYSRTIKHYYVYDYDGSNVNEAKRLNNYNTYGVLYNFPAALTGCPAGWHLPSDPEWTILEEYVGSNAGGRPKRDRIGPLEKSKYWSYKFQRFHSPSWWLFRWH